VRSDYEAENGNIAETRASMDKLLSEHNKLRAQNQNLSRELVNAKTNLHELSEWRNSVVEKSPEKNRARDFRGSAEKFLPRGSADKFGSGRK